MTPISLLYSLCSSICLILLFSFYLVVFHTCLFVCFFLYYMIVVGLAPGFALLRFKKLIAVLPHYLYVLYFVFCVSLFFLHFSLCSLPLSLFSHMLALHLKNERIKSESNQNDTHCIHIEILPIGVQRKRITN